MDGPVLLHAAWIFSLSFVWVYRRWFEPIAPRSAELSAYCARNPLLAVVCVAHGAETEVAEELSAVIGKRSEVISLFGGWPWTHHALKVRITHDSGVVRVHIDKCRVLRSNEGKLPALTEALVDVMKRAEDRAKDCWLCPVACKDMTNGVSAPRGWRLVPKSGRKRPLEPFSTVPEWAKD